MVHLPAWPRWIFSAVYVLPVAGGLASTVQPVCGTWAVGCGARGSRHLLTGSAAEGVFTPGCVSAPRDSSGSYTMRAQIKTALRRLSLAGFAFRMREWV